MQFGHLLSTIDCGVERPSRGVKLVATAGIAEADDFALIKRQTVRADRLSRPGAVRVDALFEAKVAVQA
jgi:hypothetical protein